MHLLYGQVLLTWMMCMYGLQKWVPILPYMLLTCNMYAYLVIHSRNFVHASIFLSMMVVSGNTADIVKIWGWVLNLEGPTIEHLKRCSGDIRGVPAILTRTRRPVRLCTFGSSSAASLHLRYPLQSIRTLLTAQGGLTHVVNQLRINQPFQFCRVEEGPPGEGEGSENFSADVFLWCREAEG